MIKYYFAGANRIAMRKYVIPQTMSVEYLLGDHLGSTSTTTNTVGEKVSEMRYEPWGEVRYHWVDENLSTTPAYKLPVYTFTGQRSYMDDPSTSGMEGFGLMDYNARMYDPVTGRFAQADTIVPGGVQGLDRYAYVNNSPVNYVDPSGHDPYWCDEAPSPSACRLDYYTSHSASPEQVVDDYLEAYGIQTGEGITYIQKYNAAMAAAIDGDFFMFQFSSRFGFTSSADAFRKTHGPVFIAYDPLRSGCETVGGTITCGPDVQRSSDFEHEYWHVFDNHTKNCDDSQCLISSTYSQDWFWEEIYGTGIFKCSEIQCIAHPPNYGVYTTAEAFANIGQNWVFGSMNVDLENSGFVGGDSENASEAYEVQTWFINAVFNALERIFP